MKKRTVTIRADPELKKLLNQIKIDRIKQGRNRRPLSDRRLTLAMTRIPNLKKYMEEWEIDDGQ